MLFQSDWNPRTVGSHTGRHGPPDIFATATLKRVKIIGAGSIGTHHAHACRRLGWDVTVTDVSPVALERMRAQLFPARYGTWDPSIRLSAAADVPRGQFDLIIVGTPPDSHVALALDALDESPAAVLIEKPLAPPRTSVAVLMSRSASRGVRLFVGYDHVVGRAAEMVAQEIAAGAIGGVLTIDVEFREHWAGIFQAHPWLTGPEESYLGFWVKGGGASGEHSHAINLWQYFARVSGAGLVRGVSAALDYVTEGRAVYDRLCVMALRTERGLLGRVVQDVVTRPPRKWARIQGDLAALEWHVGYTAGSDAVVIKRPGGEDDVRVIPKTRPDDFIRELEHLESVCARDVESPLDLIRGIETLDVITAAHESERTGRLVSVSGDRATCDPDTRHD